MRVVHNRPISGLIASGMVNDSGGMDTRSVSIPPSDDSLLISGGTFGNRDPDGVVLKDVSFSYPRGPTALKNVSITFGPGLNGLLGPNGAGKTTLLGLAATVLAGGTGDILVGGHDVRTKVGRREARSLLGYLPQRFEVMGQLSALNTVAYAAWAQGVSESRCESAAMKALEVVDLADKSQERVRTLSGGQRQRLGIAASISHDPPILLLDEPTPGLDPNQRVEVRRHLAALGRDRVVIVSTHLLEDIDRLCDSVVVLAGGQVKFDGTTEELRALAPVTGSEMMSPLELAYSQLVRNDDTD